MDDFIFIDHFIMFRIIPMIYATDIMYKEAPLLPNLSREGMEIRHPRIAPSEWALPEIEIFYFKS